MNNYDCIVIGAGVAGITAALYLKRSNMKVLLLEKEMPGGQINKTTLIENYPGFTKINGTDLALSMYEQIKNLDIEYKTVTVIDIIDNNELKIVKTTKEQYTAKNIVLATGRKQKKLSLENEDKLLGHGISYCAICDGNFFKNKVVAIVGGGNSALTGALYLSSIASKVIIINRSSKLRADEVFKDKINNKKNIEVLYNSKVTKLNDQNGILDSIEINNNVVKVDGLFIYIGFDPDLSYLNNLSIENNNSYIIVDNNMKTSIDGIYACGDIIDKKVYQIATAVGEAAIAATSIKHNE